jgi:hypothetical protein
VCGVERGVDHIAEVGNQKGEGLAGPLAGFDHVHLGLGRVVLVEVDALALALALERADSAPTVGGVPSRGLDVGGCKGEQLGAF